MYILYIMYIKCNGFSFASLAGLRVMHARCVGSTWALPRALAPPLPQALLGGLHWAQTGPSLLPMAAFLYTAFNTML